MKLQKRTAESILNIIGSLQGTAWKLVEGFDLDKIDKEGTFDDLMKLLDNAFRYDSRVRLPQDFDAYFSHLSRKPGETLLSYVTEHDEKLRKVQEHGIQIPDEVQGWLLLKVQCHEGTETNDHHPGTENGKTQDSRSCVLDSWSRSSFCSFP